MRQGARTAVPPGRGTRRQTSVTDMQARIEALEAQNESLTAELRDAREQQTATTEVLGVINSSPGDLAPVFDAILEKARLACGAPHGDLWVRDGDVLQLAATQGEPGFAKWLWQHPKVPLWKGSPPERVVLGEEYVQFDDAREDDSFRLVPEFLEQVERAGLRSTLLVPLRKEDVVFGVIVVYRSEVRPFTKKQIALLQNFAAQAVIAMENARLITETREALEQQTATAEVLGVINSSPGDLAPVFEAILEKAHTLCGAAHGSLAVYDGELFHAVATHGQSETFTSVLRRPRPASPVHQRLQAGERFVQIADMKTLTVSPSDIVTPAAVEAGIRTQLFVPLRKDGLLLGYITAHRHEVRPFSEKEIALLENFAAQAVIAIENARLIAETQEALEQQTATAEVLGVINSSPGDLTPVFDAILAKALRLCDAAFGHLLTFDGEQFDTAAVHGEPRLVEHLRQRGPFRVEPDDSLLGRIVGAAVDVGQIADVLETNTYRTSDHFRAMVDIGGYRSLLNVALRKENVLFGVILIFRKEARPFSDKQIALLQNFAQQAVIAMENARLLGELRQRTEEVAELNRGLEARVAEQVEELGRVGRLKRFLAPQLAELIVSQGDERILESHRREIVVVFCDMRGFTAFAERAEPEEVMALLREYHAAMGPIVAQFEGTIDHYGGDGIMVFFNDPLPMPDPARRAIDMAVAMRERAKELLHTGRRHGHHLGFGVGISQGYATLGQIGFAERMDYTAIGTVTNLAARLCAEAKDGQILVSRRVAIAVEDSMALEEIGDLSLKGLSQAVAVYNVVALGAETSAS
jgi:class 3 adenylate cyclase/putative methionine-R-sulfoxide reductase with GAF domain